MLVPAGILHTAEEGRILGGVEWTDAIGKVSKEGIEKDERGLEKIAHFFVSEESFGLYWNDMTFLLKSDKIA